MAVIKTKAKGRNERGMALLLALFALLLLSAIGLFMVLSSNTETRIDANYSNSLRSYYSAKSGMEEVRDRMSYLSTATAKPGGLLDLLPQDIAGNTNGMPGVLYVENPANGEVVDPTDITSSYFDDQLCHDFNSGVASAGTKCTVLPTTTNWLATKPANNASVQLGYKWVRINMKTNRTAAPYCVDGSFDGNQSCATATLDTRVCWDGQTEQLSPGGDNPSCDANGMQTVYMLTSLAATPQVGGPGGSRSLVRSEVAAPSIRPAGMVTAGAMGTLPAGIPGVAIDGRAHDINGVLVAAAPPPADGSPAPPVTCSDVAPLATNSSTSTQQLESALNTIRKNIVIQANASCDQYGNGNLCTYGLWWVRGTDAAPRFVTSGGTSSPVANPMTEGFSSGNGPGGPGDGDGSNGSNGSGKHHHHHPSGAPDSTGACDPTNPSCYTNLNLASRELFATAPPSTTPIAESAPAPFAGGSGNQADTTIYQPGSVTTITNEIQVVLNLVAASRGSSNYYYVSQASMASSYGSADHPAIVEIQDQTLNLPTPAGLSLTGYGVLVIPSGLNISGSLQWTGIVLIESATGQVTVNPGATGFINGALLLQPGAALNLLGSASTSAASPNIASPTFSLSYSCDAIDQPFRSMPFKIISSTESSQ